MYLAIITWKRQKLAKKCQLLEKQKKTSSNFQAWFSATTQKKEEKVTNNHSFKLDHKVFLKEFQVTQKALLHRPICKFLP